MKLIVVLALAMGFGAVAAGGHFTLDLGFFIWWMLIMFGLGLWVSNSRHKNIAIATAHAEARSKARAEASSVAHSQQAVVVNVGGEHRRLDRSEYAELYDGEVSEEIGWESDSQESSDDAAREAYAVEMEGAGGPGPEGPRPPAASSPVSAAHREVFEELADLVRSRPRSTTPSSRQSGDQRES